jgi:3-phenylpropionate/trans-cinnamate dioxygenase ferredoxin reductase subunit
VVHGSVEDGRFVALYGRAGRLVGALAFSWPRLLMQYRGLLSRSATWDEAVEHAAAVS